MLTLVLRRAFAQRWLLAAVVLLLVAAASLVGVCSLLLGVTQDRAFHEEARRLQPQDVDVTAYVLDLPASDLVRARGQAQAVVRDVLAATHPDLTTTATGPMRRLDGTDRLAYLVSDDGLAQHAVLTSGRWPAGADAGPMPAVVPVTTARLLGLELGDRVTLGPEVVLGGVDNSLTVVVVGTFRPRSTVGWETDPLSGAGVDPEFSNGTVTAPAYGPFAVADASFLASGSSASSLRVTAHPSLSLADETALRAAASSLDHASALLSARVGEVAGVSRVGSDLPQTLDRVTAQQGVTRSTVLVVLLLATGLSVAAALLAGRLVASVRADERELLASFGLGRRQQVWAALLEALLLSFVAALLAVPVAAVTHSLLTHLPALRAAHLAQSPALTWGLALAAVAGALLPAVALVAAAQSEVGAVDPTARRWTMAAFGLDALLLAVAGVGWWQLRSPPSADATRSDTVLTLAPVLCLAATTVVAVRLVPPLLGAAAGAMLRSRDLVIPLAVQQAARRPRAATAMVLLAAAAAAAVFGLALQQTWARSQEDQATLSVGTDLSLTLPAPADAQQAAAIATIATAADAERTGGSPEPVVSVVVDRPLALGRYVGDTRTRPVLVAIDARHAGVLLRGRLEGGESWADVGARLAPEKAVRGLPLPVDGAGIDLEGAAPLGAGLTVTPTAVVEDAVGFRHSVPAGALPLDGRSHPVRWLEPIGQRQRLVGVRLDVAGSPAEDPTADPEVQPPAEVTVTVRIPGRDPQDGRSWQVRPLDNGSVVSGAVASVGLAGGSTELRTAARVDLTYFAYSGVSLLATAFATPPEVPAAVSRELADAVETKVGGRLSAVVDGTAVQLRVAAIVPTVPSAPGRLAVLADADTLSRALIGSGSLDPVVDGWWVGHPTADLVDQLSALEFGTVTTKQQVADQLSQGPLRASVPAALLTLVLASAAMLLAGVILVLSAERHSRAVEVARLRALGLTRRDARRLLLVEYGAFLVPLVIVGTLIGAAAAALLGPHLIRSDRGAAPVPAVLVAWPWVGEALLVGGLLLGAVVITAVMTARVVRRADPASMRGRGV